MRCAVRLLCVAVMMIGVPNAVHADGSLLVSSNAAWVSECGACHIPYPPTLLAPQAWGRIMLDLRHHFGVDASVDPIAQKEISTFLSEQSRLGRHRGDLNVLRITKSAWFMRKHDEIAPDVWKRPSVRAASNCAACHREAERGIYSEHAVRVPR